MSELARPEREDDMTKQIHHVTVVGAGGMGALFGAILSEGGLEVTLVDTNREHIDAIQKNGLLVSGYGDNRRLMLKAHMTLNRLSKLILCWYNVREQQPIRQRLQ